MNRQQTAMGQMANVVARMQEQQRQNYEIVRNGMRADVAVMLDGLRRAQHAALERERMQQAVAQRHLDLAEADRRRMMDAVYHITE